MCSSEQLEEFQFSLSISEPLHSTLSCGMSTEPDFSLGCLLPSCVASDTSLVVCFTGSPRSPKKTFHSLSAKKSCDFLGLWLRTGRDFICSQLDTTRRNQRLMILKIIDLSVVCPLYLVNGLALNI